MRATYHYQLRKHLVGLAERYGIDYQLDIYPYYGSDASAAIRSYDIVHGLIVRELTLHTLLNARMNYRFLIRRSFCIGTFYRRWHKTCAEIIPCRVLT